MIQKIRYKNKLQKNLENKRHANTYINDSKNALQKLGAQKSSPNWKKIALFLSSLFENTRELSMKIFVVTYWSPNFCIF